MLRNSQSVNIQTLNVNKQTFNVNVQTFSVNQRELSKKLQTSETQCFWGFSLYMKCDGWLFSSVSMAGAWHASAYCLFGKNNGIIGDGMV